MSNPLDPIIVEEILFPNDINLNFIQDSIIGSKNTSIDFIDIFFEKNFVEFWGLENGIVKNGVYNVEQGFGTRVISGSSTGLSVCNEITKTNIKNSLKSASNISINSNSNSKNQFNDIKINNKVPRLYTEANPSLQITCQQKIDFLKNIESYVAKFSNSIVQTNINLSAQWQLVLIIATDGTLAYDIRPLVRVNCSIVTNENGKNESGYAGGGGRFALTSIMNDEYAQKIAKEAVRLADIAHLAEPAPAGTMEVVLGPGWPGVLLHEAVGHGLEGDFNRKKTSYYSDKINSKVASDLCTIVDDGTLDNRRGSISIDDEGTPSKFNVLIENGVLKQFMYDKLNAKLSNTESTGNGRRESFAHQPLPRMTNTYMLAGTSEHDEIIRSCTNGIYCKMMSGGQVDITSGDFVFSTSEAYKIENGKIKYPIKDATLIGHGPTSMQKITMVGNDLELDNGIGTCGKDGQSVPVGVGQPSLKISEMVVGGAK